MKTFMILAAGNSTRFGSDKLLEPISGLTLPQRCAIFAEENGAERICVTVNRTSVRTDGKAIYHPVVEDIRQILTSKVSVEVSFQGKDSYGPGAAITAWEGKVKEDFIVLFGDNFYKGKLPSLLPDQTYFSYCTFGPNPRNLQLATVKGGYVIEKPHAQLEGDFFCGFVHFPTNFFNSLPALQRSSRGEYEITDMINLANTPVPLSIKSIGMTWADLTYKSDIDHLEQLVL